MSVRLIAMTQHSNDLNSAEDLLAYCARVSNPKSQEEGKDASGLLRYLVTHQHWSPFEMVHVVMEIVTTRDIARQILRHRSFSFQEFSQRYAAVTAPPVFREARLQDTRNRQNSLENWDEALNHQWQEAQRVVYNTARNMYEQALARGIAKEVARAVLPEGMTESRMYMAGTLRSWIHYVQLRTANGTQKEHIDIAKQCEEILIKEFPVLNGVL